LVLLLPPLAVLLAGKIPSGTVDFEDSYVKHNSGVLYPDRWKTARQNLRGGWRLFGSRELVAPIVAGGVQAEIQFEFKALRPVRVEVGRRSPSDTTLFGEFLAVRSDEWKTVSLGPVPWTSDADLTVRLLPYSKESAGRGAVILDRVRFSWE
jgi:hypothetical protein